MSKFGITNLKKCVRFATSVGNEFQNSLADGKFSGIEAFNFIDEVAQLPEIINNRAEIVAEAKDIDSVEGQELREYVRTELNIANEKVEDVIDSAINWVLATAQLVVLSKSLKS